MSKIQLNQPRLAAGDEPDFLKYLSNIVKRGRHLRAREMSPASPTLPYRIYAKSSKSSRGKK